MLLPLLKWQHERSTKMRGGVNVMNLFQYVHLKVLVSNAEHDAPWKLDQEVQTWNDPCITETGVMGKSEIPLEENMKRTKTAGI